MDIGIIGAMQVEVDLLVDAMQDRKTEQFGKVTYHSGTISGVECVVSQSGIGGIAMASCAQRMIDKYGVKLIINTGIAGSLVSELTMGDVVVADDTILHAADMTIFNYPLGQMQGFPHTFKASERVNKVIMDALSELVTNNTLKFGRIASADQFIHTEERRSEISKTFNALACEMESAPLGEVAYLNDIEYAVVRSISDAGETSEDDYTAYETRTAHQMAELLIKILPDVQKVING